MQQGNISKTFSLKKYRDTDTHTLRFINVGKISCAIVLLQFAGGVMSLKAMSSQWYKTGSNVMVAVDGRARFPNIQDPQLERDFQESSNSHVGT